jgi:hypothetical protein
MGASSTMPKIAAILALALLCGCRHTPVRNTFAPSVARARRSRTMKVRAPFRFIDCVIVKRDARALTCACDDAVANLNARTGGTDITCLSDASWNQSLHRCGTPGRWFAADSGGGCAEELGAIFVPGWEPGKGTSWGANAAQAGVGDPGRDESRDANPLLPDPPD